MEECIVCGERALYRCQPCVVLFCEEHKRVHERNKNKVHIFESIIIRPDSRQYAKIVESLVIKITEFEAFKSRIILETKTLIQKIKELRTNCLAKAESKVRSYITLLKQIQNPATSEDLTIVENQLNVSLSFPVPPPSFQEILSFYNYEFFQDVPASPQNLEEHKSMPTKSSKELRIYEIPVQRLEELKSMPIANIKQVLSEEFSLFLEGHTASIYCVRVTNDNQYIISGSGDNTIRIWDLKDKRQEWVLQGHTGAVLGLAVTRDNRFLVSASVDFTVRIWDLHQKIQIGMLRGHAVGVYGIAVSNDSLYIASVSKDKTVRLWDFQNHSIYAVLQGHSEGVNCVAITSDSRYAISGSDDKTLIIWSIKNKSLESCLRGHSSSVTCLAVTSDNSYILSGSGDKSIGIWNFQLKKLEITLEGHTATVTGIAVLSDRIRLVSASHDKTIRLWNLRNRKQEGILKWTY